MNKMEVFQDGVPSRSRGLMLDKNRQVLIAVLLGFFIQALVAQLDSKLILVVQFFLVLLVAAIQFRSKSRLVAMFVAIIVWGTCTVFNYLYVDPIGTPDAYRYWVYYLDYASDPGVYMQSILNEVLSSKLYDVSSYSIIAAVCYPIINILFSADVLAGFSVLNFTFAMLTFWLGISIAAKSPKNEAALKLAFFLWLLSPVVILHYQTFTKDIISTFLCVACVRAVLNRNFLFAVFVFVIATMLRPYAIAIVFCIYNVVAERNRELYLGLIASAALVVIFAGSAGVVNMLITAGYMPLSPNFFAGIERQEYFLLYVESFITFLAFMFVAAACVKTDYLRVYVLPLLSAIFIYSAVMVLLGRYSTDYYGEDYGAGSMGNNALRKKIPVLFLFFYLIASAFYYFKINRGSVRQP